MELRAIAERLSGTVAETVDDPEYITNRAMAHYGERDGLAIVLSEIERHLLTPHRVERDGSAYSQAFIAGVGCVQLSSFPGDYFRAGERPYLALSFAPPD